MRHWTNPYPEALDTTIDEILDHAVFGTLNRDKIAYRESLKAIIFQHKEGLDPYILPSSNGHHCLGIRYGEKPFQYMSFSSSWGSKELEDILIRAKARAQESAILIP